MACNGDLTTVPVAIGDLAGSLSAPQISSIIAGISDLPVAASIVSPMDGVAAVGISSRYARQDHVHDSDTSRAAIAQTMNIGTTALAINRGSGAVALTGITSIDGSAATITGTVPVASDRNGIHNFNTGALTLGGGAGTYYYITNSNLAMPAVYKTAIAAGTTMRWCVYMKKTAAGTGAFNIRLYSGTNGSTSDATLVTQSIGTATAALDDLCLEVTLVFTSATAAFWSIGCTHSAATIAGFGCATGSCSFSGTLSGLTTTTASLIFGIGYSNTTGTAVITINQVQAEALGVN